MYKELGLPGRVHCDPFLFSIQVRLGFCPRLFPGSDSRVGYPDRVFPDPSPLNGLGSSAGWGYPAYTTGEILGTRYFLMYDELMT